MPGPNGIHMQAVFEDLSKASWPEPLWDSLGVFFARAGITRIAYYQLPPLGAPDEGHVSVQLRGFPETWAQRYVEEKLHRTDPLLAHALATEEPFFCDSLTGRRTLTEEETRTLALQRKAGLCDAIAVQVFGPTGRNGYFALGRPEDGSDLDPGRVRLFQSVCQLAHLRCCAFRRATLAEPPGLSRRESELLLWVARGKSNSVIADLMEISPHTVDAYLRRVFLKLGTSDRITAAIRGLGSGVIHGY